MDNKTLIELKAEDLKYALAIADRIAGKNPTMPVLQSVLFSVQKTKAILSATNLESGVEVSVKGVIKKTGEFLLPAGVFYSYIKLLQNSETIILHADEFDIYIDTGRQKTKIRGTNPTEFPPFPKPTNNTQAIFNTKDLCAKLKKVLVATSNFNIKQELSSVYIQITKKHTTLAATDSFRLSEEVIDCEKNENETKTEILVPVRTIEECVRILESTTATQTIIQTSSSGVLFIVGDVNLFSRTVDGKFPDYTQIIPQTFQTETVAPTQELLHALQQAKVFSSKLNEIKLTFIPDEGIKIQTENKDVGAFESILPASVRGSGEVVVLNWRYINDIIHHTTTDEVYIGANGGQDPILVRPTTQQHSIHVIMPMKTI